MILLEGWIVDSATVREMAVVIVGEVVGLMVEEMVSEAVGETAVVTVGDRDGR